MPRPAFSILFAMLLPLLAHAEAEKPLRVALILDDGPFAGVTENWLKIFEKEKIHVTFGTVARNAAANPELTRAAAKAGHEIVNHSLSHEHPGPLSDDKLSEQILGAQKVLEENVGVKPRWYWPPYVEIEPRVVAFAEKAGLKVYSYKNLVASMDFINTKTAAELYTHATTGIEDGTVILFHEWRKESAEQMPAILAELRRQGCVFMTYSELAAEIAK